MADTSNMSVRRLLLVIAAVMLTVWASGASRVVAATPEAIHFQPLEQAVANARQQHRVIAVFFTAEWCGWCKRMAAESFTDPRVLAEASEFVWVKVDIDQQPDFAAQFGVRGVPAVVWFNASGEFLDRVSGYMPSETLRTKLAELKGKAEEHSRDVQLMLSMVKSADELLAADNPTERANMVRQIVHTASTPRVERRQLAERILKQAGRAAWPGLVQCLGSDKLAERAAAYDLLCDMTGQSLAFDPFADADARAGQIVAWRKWLENLPPAEQPATPAPPAAPAP